MQRTGADNGEGLLVSRQSSGLANVLSIDDEASIRRLLRLILERERHEILEARDGRDGLTAYQRSPADLVIADIRIPEMTGLDVIIELTRRFLDAKVIAISGQADASDTLSNAKLLGARHSLAQTVQPEDIPEPRSV